jgi:hypothetical protein
VAALFALHPAATSSRSPGSPSGSDVLSTFFSFLTLAAYGAYVRRPYRGSLPGGLGAPRARPDGEAHAGDACVPPAPTSTVCRSGGGVRRRAPRPPGVSCARSCRSSRWRYLSSVVTLFPWQLRGPAMRAMVGVPTRVANAVLAYARLPRASRLAGSSSLFLSDAAAVCRSGG